MRFPSWKRFLQVSGLVSVGIVIGLTLVLIEPPGLRDLIDEQVGSDESETARTQTFVEGEATALVKDRLLRSLSPLFRELAEYPIPPSSEAKGCKYSILVLTLAVSGQSSVQVPLRSS